MLLLASKNDAFDAFKNLYKEFKMKKDIFPILEMIMEENLKITHLKVSAMILSLKISFLGLHNKVELLREKIDQFRK